MPPLEQQWIHNRKFLAWDGCNQEIYQRNAGLKLAFQLSNPQEGDWVIVSDLDEVPRKSVLLVIRYAKSQNLQDRIYYMASDTERREEGMRALPFGHDVYILDCQFFQLSYEYRTVKGTIGLMVFLYREARSPVLGYLRSTLRPHHLDAHNVVEANNNSSKSSPTVHKSSSSRLH